MSIEELQMTTPTNAPIHPQVKVGHVHLRVADLDRALQFYCGVLGFEVMQRTAHLEGWGRHLSR